MKHAVVAAALLLHALFAGAELLPLRQAPLIAGEMGVNVLVEVDGTVMAWGIHDDKDDKWVTKPIPLFKVKLAN